MKVPIASSAGKARVLPTNAREAMEAMNRDATGLWIWLRTQANAPAQRPWFSTKDADQPGQMAHGRVGAGQQKVQAHQWRWEEISPYLHRIAQVAKESEVAPINFADRQQFLLINPGLGNRLQVTSTIRCAVSIYNPGDVAPVHLHTPNASRLILSDEGGYTSVDGERCNAERGDLILTPHGTWHDHGNDSSQPVIWMDVLDWPLLEALDCIWLDEDYQDETLPVGRVQKPNRPVNYSRALYSAGGLLPKIDHNRGLTAGTCPMIHFSGRTIKGKLEELKGYLADPYEGVMLEFVNPVSGGPLFPTLSYTAQTFGPQQELLSKRETCSRIYTVLRGSGVSAVGDQMFDWKENDIFVVPGFTWRRHECRGSEDAILYSVSDQPLFDKIQQYRAQGKRQDGSIEQIVK